MPSRQSTGRPSTTSRAEVLRAANIAVAAMINSGQARPRRSASARRVAAAVADTGTRTRRGTLGVRATSPSGRGAPSR
nr:hypothetical protein [Herbihabitans rhizosphaerae]